MIQSTTRRASQPVRERNSRGATRDFARAIVVVLVLERREPRVVSPVVVPAQLLARDVPQKGLVRRHVHGSRHVREAGDRVALVESRARPILAGIAEVLCRAAEIDSRIGLRTRRGDGRAIRHRRGWDDAVGVATADRAANLAEIVATEKRDAGGHRAAAPIVAVHAARVRKESANLRAARFEMAGLKHARSVEPRSPAIVGSIVDAAPLSLKEGKLAVPALPEEVLVCGQAERLRDGDLLTL